MDLYASRKHRENLVSKNLIYQMIRAKWSDINSVELMIHIVDLS